MHAELYSGSTPQTLATSMQATAGKTHDTQRERVYDYVKAQGINGATGDEMQIGLNIPQNSQNPRRQELWLEGRIEPTGLTRETQYGEQGVVWVAVEDERVKAAARKARRQWLQTRIVKGERMIEQATRALEEMQHVA